MVSPMMMYHGTNDSNPFFTTRSELIHYGMELVNGKRTLLDLTSRLYAAVTFHEMYRMAAEDGLDPKLGRKRRAAAGRALAQRNRKIQQKESI